jgi:uncharacterized ferritin-like protein (DUF455 family)
VFAFCRRILDSGDLAAKLEPPQPRDFEADLEASLEGWELPALWPSRDAPIRMQAGVERLPRPRALGEATARAICLARFAHHELMAVEMFAWAILRWPELPHSMRCGFLGILRDEQNHCRLYLERLDANGSSFSEHVLSDYFWKHARAISESSAGPAAFLASMGLTFEQGNLDFAPLYRDAFREGGDEASARVCERVHEDEIEHVRFAARSMRELAKGSDLEGANDVTLYEAAIPFPLSAARAKGRRFDADARIAAGLSRGFIDYVRTARSPQELGAHPDRIRSEERTG